MNEKIKNGGAAFPTLDSGLPGFQLREFGMTLRDYFAVKTMEAHLMGNVDLKPEDVAKWSYEYADAMLAERERGE